MKVLVLNCGSSSIKYRLHDTVSQRALARGLVSRIGEERAQLEAQSDGEKHIRQTPIPDHGRGLELILKALLDRRTGVVGSLSEISAVGHRVVHGGSFFEAPAVLTADVIDKIERCAPLAPLHNPPALVGIREALRALPHARQAAVFDTAFHATIPPKAHVYAIPYEYYERYDVRRYGFHGISFQAVSERSNAILDGKLSELRVVIAHLGNGASVAAVDRGKCVDTSMGMTPLEGLVMGTRPGDLDPGVVLFLMRELAQSLSEVDDMLNKRSGVLGLSGVSNDIRDVRARAVSGDQRCQLALDIFAQRVKKYIGSFAAVMGGLDALVFTAGVGENDSETRAEICEGLSFLGVSLSREANSATRGTEGVISAPGSKVHVLVVPTDEERLIADETVAAIGGNG